VQKYSSYVSHPGNCLFSALSDQIFGDPSHHADIRQNTVNYMRGNAESFLLFHVTKEARRNPKRKNVGGYSSPILIEEHTDIERMKSFERHCDKMEKNAEWGDQMEIQAFADAYECSVRIYEEDSLLVQASRSNPQTTKQAHIAHHVCVIGTISPSLPLTFLGLATLLLHP
jgi:OTU domain-containing protein 3